MLTTLPSITLPDFDNVYVIQPRLHALRYGSERPLDLGDESRSPQFAAEEA